MPVRKLIVKTCVREVILDNDSVTITYNFTENYTKYKISKETIEEIKRQSLKKTAYNKNRCSNKLPSLPPSETRLNFWCSSEFFFVLGIFSHFSIFSKLASMSFCILSFNHRKAIGIRIAENQNLINERAHDSLLYRPKPFTRKRTAKIVAWSRGRWRIRQLTYRHKVPERLRNIYRRYKALRRFCFEGAETLKEAEKLCITNLS